MQLPARAELFDFSGYSSKLNQNTVSEPVIKIGFRRNLGLLS